MDPREDIREFLTTRRARLKPEQVGLPGYGPRRVPGLRREEVAVLAGVSVPYYTKLERGDLGRASASVLDALARALRLDDAERAHLHDLARAAQPAVRSTARAHGQPQPPRAAGRDAVRPGIRRLLDAITGAAAIVQNGRGDLLAANLLGRALYAPIFESPEQPANHARFIFLDERSPGIYLEWWSEAADITVELLRVTAGRDPYDRELSDLIGQLSTRSEPFRTRWASHDVRTHRTGAKTLRHPLVGALELTFEVLDLAADGDLSLLVYTAEPGTPSAEALALLGSWAATEALDARTPADR